jgi:hypothetical protein
MTEGYIDACLREFARVLQTYGYLMLWADAFNLLMAHHRRVADVLHPVGKIDWDNGRKGNGASRPTAGQHSYRLAEAEFEEALPNCQKLE